MSELIKREIERHGEMRPPWRAFDFHPFSLGWRMGAGEDHMAAFRAWWSERRAEWGETERIAYLKRWPGRPGWTYQMIGLVWDLNAIDLLPFEEEDSVGDDPVDDVSPDGAPAEPEGLDRTAWFARGEAAGFPSLAASDADLYDPSWPQD